MVVGSYIFVVEAYRAPSLSRKHYRLIRAVICYVLLLEFLS